MKIFSKKYIAGCVFCVLVMHAHAAPIPQLGLIPSGSGTQEVYVPPPMVLVHGINSSALAWNTVQQLLSSNSYFLNSDGSEKYKYNLGFQKSLISPAGGNYVLYPFAPAFDYNATNNDSFVANGQRLRDFINNNIITTAGPYGSNFTPIDESGTKGILGAGKIFIFCHSMGGLLTRYVLKQDSTISDHVWGVGTVGTPNFGSYAGSLGMICVRVVPQCNQAISILNNL